MHYKALKELAASLIGASELDLLLFTYLRSRIRKNGGKALQNHFGSQIILISLLSSQKSSRMIPPSTSKRLIKRR